MKTLSMTAGAVAVAMLAGCASQPPAELKTARSTYQEVAQSPAVNASPADVYEAKKALDRAKRAVLSLSFSLIPHHCRYHYRCCCCRRPPPRPRRGEQQQ
jgi:hypothetical protein